MFDQVGGLSREEVAGMIERATSNFLKTMKGEHTVSPCIGVFTCGRICSRICMRPRICICIDYVRAPLQNSFGPFGPVVVGLGHFRLLSFKRILKNGRWPVVVLVIPSSIRISLYVVQSSNVQQIFAIVKNVKDEFCQLYFMSLLKCIAEFTGGWKEIFGKVCVSASLAKSRPTWYISAALHTQRTTQRQGNRQTFLKAKFLFAAIHWLSTQQSFVQVLEMPLHSRVLFILYSGPAELCVFFEMQQSSVFVPRSPRAFFPSCTSLSYV